MRWPQNLKDELRRAGLRTCQLPYNMPLHADKSFRTIAMQSAFWLRDLNAGLLQGGSFSSNFDLSI